MFENNLINSGDIIKVLCFLLIIILVYILVKCHNLYKSNNGLFIRGNVNNIDIEDEGYIPRIVFKTGISDYDKLDDQLKFLFNKIVKENENFKLEYYSDSDSREFIKNNYDLRVLAAYDKLKPGSYKADLFRYAVLYKRGGIYSDLTQNMKVPLNEIIDFNNDNLVLVEDRPQPNFRGPRKGFIVHGIQISFMATRPKNSIYLDAINEVVKNCENNFYGGNPLSPTGPHMFKRILERYHGRYRIALKENGSHLVYKSTNKKAIINRTKNHYKVHLNNSYKNGTHYSILWRKNDIYN